MPYFLIVLIQIVCIIHVIRKNKEYGWIFLIIFVPVIGCIVYIITQMLNRSSLDTVQENINTVINPTGKIKDLEKKVRFSDTFDNKVELAYAYLNNKQLDEAIELFNSCLTGIFKEDPHVLMGLSVALFKKEEYQLVVDHLSKIKEHSDFKKTNTHLLYALSFERLGKLEEAEREFLALRGTQSQIEFRFEYGLFLTRQNRIQEAIHLYQEIMNEVEFMDRVKKRREAVWLRKVQTELSQLNK